MLQMKKSLLAALALAAVVSAPKAYALPGMDIGVMGGANFAKYSSGVDSAFGFSGGASVGLGPLEVSALYTQYKFSATLLGQSVSTTLNQLDVPVLYRLGVGPVSLGVGGFYSMFLSGSTSSNGVSTSVTSGNSNYGATASARFTIPVLGFFVDGRYNLGLKDNSGVKTSSMAAYLGWNIL
jgi:Outer membrane protein beta-barrel domain